MTLPSITISAADIVSILGALGTFVAAVAAAYTSIRNHRVMKRVEAQTDGISKELQRKNTALKMEVARVSENPESVTPEQLAGGGGAPVGISKGVVTVEDADRFRRKGDTQSTE